MHALAERKAVEMGPRVLSVNGQENLAYYLTKKELSKLFSMNGFNTDGVPWLKQINKFVEVWNEVGPNSARILNKEDNNWRICFVHLNQSDLITLKFFSEDKNIPILAAVAE